MFNFNDLFGNEYGTAEIMAKFLAICDLLVNKGIITEEEYKNAMSEENLNKIQEEMKEVRKAQYTKYISNLEEMNK